jgi:parvulin-like peptidyl-prolyl isomerase
VKRHRAGFRGHLGLPGIVIALVVIGSGAFASACDVTPTAASANGSTISRATLNSQLRALETTGVGNCLMQLEDSALTPATAQGAGGPGTYSMAFTSDVLDNQVGDLLAQEYAASKGITVSSSDLATAKSDLEATLDGEISQQVQSAESEGVVSACMAASGADLTGAQVLSGLPSDVAAAQILNQAVDEKLLARGADLSPSAILTYYAANKPQFTVACVSVITTGTEASADQIVDQLNGGASFAAVAKASSLDAQTAADGGLLGCDYTQAQVEQALQQQAVTVGQPIAPVQDPSTGQWVIYEVTSQSLEPLSAVTSVVRRELLQVTTNVDRVSREIVAFGHRSEVSVDPQYGTWKALTVVPPPKPPSKFLLGAASGSSSSSSPAPLDLNGSGSTGTGSAGSSSSSSGG